MTEANCPIAYDHSDDLGYCAVCGWEIENERRSTEPRRPLDMSTLTGPQKIREAIDRLNGAYAPQRPVTFICGDDPYRTDNA